MSHKFNIDVPSDNFTNFIPMIMHGDEVLVCKDNIPFAKITPIQNDPNKKREFGFYKGQIVMDKTFTDPLPDEILDYFTGKK